MAIAYYLMIDGLNGGSTAVAAPGAFDVSGFDLAIDETQGASAGGASAGKTTFGPLTVTIPAGSSLAALLQKAATANVIRSARLIGVKSSGGTFYDLLLGDVIVSSVDDQVGSDAFSLSYDRLSLTTTPQNPNGSPGAPTNFSYNLGATPIPDPTVGGIATSSNAITYYLTIDGLNGGSTSARHAGSFAINDFDLPVANTSTPSGSGASAGVTDVGPLDVTLPAGSGLTALLQQTVAGAVFRSARIEGVNANGQTVYDLLLGSVMARNVASASGQDVAQFDFASVSLTTTPQNSNGSLGMPTTFFYKATAGSIGAPVVGGSSSATNAVTYYLTVDGLNGGSTVLGQAGAFAVQSFDFAVGDAASASGGGGSAGRPTFGPLDVTVPQGTGLTALLQKSATGNTIPAVRLAGVNSNGQTVYDLKLGDVVLNDVDASSTSGALSFSYAKVSLTTSTQTTSGPFDSQTFAYDLRAGTTSPTITSPTPGGVSAGSAHAVAYFLTIGGLNGGSSVPGHEMDFEIASFDLPIGNTTSPSAGSGAGAGKTTLGPLTVMFGADTGLTALLQKAAAGAIIPSVRIVGLTSSGQSVYDLRLANAVISKLDGASASDSAAFSYSKIDLTVTPQNSNGTLGTPQTFAYNTTAGSVPAPTAGGTAAGSAHATTYYLAINGVNGGSTAAGHAGAFLVNGFDLPVSNSSSPSNGGASAGVTSFGPLTVALAVGTDLSSLLRMEATGVHPKSAQLVGVTASGQTVYDLRLGNIVVGSVDMGDATDSLSLNFDKIALTMTPQHSDGSLGAPQTFGDASSIPAPALNLVRSRRDFDADGVSDILWRNSAGVSYLWTMNGATVVGGATTSVQVGLNWQITGEADFDGNGSADILWAYDNASNASDPLNGVSYISFQTGAAATGGDVVQQLPTAWQLVGVGDFNGDGMSDVLYRNTSTGQTYLDIMNGGLVNWIASGFTSMQETDQNWHVAAVADFNGDGDADVLWRYQNAANASDPLNGALYEWTMNGTAVTGAGKLSAQSSSNWEVVGADDFNGDRRADILFRYNNAGNPLDALNGATYIDFMNGLTVTSGASTQWQIDNSWQIASLGDYNGDGMSDILWRRTSTGKTFEWQMNGADVVSGAFTSQQAGGTWNVQNGIMVG